MLFGRECLFGFVVAYLLSGFRGKCVYQAQSSHSILSDVSMRDISVCIFLLI